MVEAKLTVMGHEPQNVQVVLEEGNVDGRLTLQDQGGEILTVAPLVEPTSVERSYSQNQASPVTLARTDT